MTRHRLWFLGLGAASVLLLLFVALSPLLPPTITDPTTWQRAASVSVAVAAVALLASDVVLPVPSSVVMVANGAVFGAVGGAALSTLGATLSAVLGYAIGRTTGERADRWLGEPAADQLRGLVERRGTVIVIASRPVPLVAEVVAIFAGNGGMGWRRFLVAAVVGAACTSAPYAVAGAAAGREEQWWPMVAAFVLAAATWLIGRRLPRSVTSAR